MARPTHFIPDPAVAEVMCRKPDEQKLEVR